MNIKNFFKNKKIVYYITIPLIFHGLLWIIFFAFKILWKLNYARIAEMLGFVGVGYALFMMIIMPILMIGMAIKHLKEYKWDPLYITIYSTIFIAAMLPLFKAAMFGFGMAVRF